MGATNPTIHIPFFFPPPRVLSHLVMATPYLPKLILALHVWYLEHPTYAPDPLHMVIHPIEPTFNSTRNGIG